MLKRPRLRTAFVRLGSATREFCLPLESRFMLSTYVVNWTGDALVAPRNALSLRQAIAKANADPAEDTITFSPTAFPTTANTTITLTLGQLSLTATGGRTTIAGPGSKFLTISGNMMSRCFSIASGASANLSGMQISTARVTGATGHDGTGGAIINQGTLGVSNCLFYNNVVYGGPTGPGYDIPGTARGGAIYNTGTLTISGCTFNANAARGGNGTVAGQRSGHGYGGGIYSTTALVVSGCTFKLNVGQGGAPTSTNQSGGGESKGGAIYAASTLNCSSSTFTSNDAVGGIASELALQAMGGAIYAVGAVTLTSVTMSSNYAEGGTYNTVSEAWRGDGGAAYGGAVASQASVSISNSQLTDNRAMGGESAWDDGVGGAAYGGAIYAAGAVTAIDSTLSSNSSLGGWSPDDGDAGSGDGGAISSIGAVTLTRTTISSNKAHGGNTGISYAGGLAEGGGVSTQGALSATASTISQNWAIGGVGSVGDFMSHSGPGGNAFGGGVYIFGAGTFVNTALSGNKAQGGTGGSGDMHSLVPGAGGMAQGGAVYCPLQLTFTSCTLADNSVTGGKGGNTTDAPEQASRGGVGGNAAGGAIYGGGLLVDRKIKLTNCTLTRNLVQGGAGGNAFSSNGIAGAGGNAAGGAIWAGVATEISNVTVTANNVIYGVAGTTEATAGVAGAASAGGVYVSNSYYAPSINNSIVSGNKRNSSIFDDLVGYFTATSGGNLIGVGGNLINGTNGNKVGFTNPMLNALANNGGPTYTMMPQPTSPVLNAGMNSLIPSGVTTDQRGVTRILGGTVDIGAVEMQTGAITGVVWNDSISDGTIQTTEAKLSGRTIFIDRNANGVYDSGTDTAATSSSTGSFLLSGLLPGTYSVYQVVPSGWRPTVPIGSYSVTLVAGQLVTRNFGSTTNTQINGNVFQDSNANGVKDAGEPNLSGWRVYTDKNGDKIFNGDTVENNKTTDASGNYSFQSLPAGTYTLRVDEVQNSGWICFYPTGAAQVMTLSAGQIVSGKNFGYYKPASIAGNVFNDVNSNGTKESTEAYVVGAKVYIDANKNGVLDSSESTSTTNSGGGWSFTNLKPGTYRIREAVASGYRVTTPSAMYYDVTVTSGQAVTGKAFGQTSNALISGSVFNDANGDAIKQSTETGLSSWRVFVDANKDGLWQATEKSVLSDSSGNWKFIDLPAGTYVVRLVQQPNWTLTTPSSGSFSLTLTSGASVTGKLFGEKAI